MLSTVVLLTVIIAGFARVVHAAMTHEAIQKSARFLAGIGGALIPDQNSESTEFASRTASHAQLTYRPATRGGWAAHHAPGRECRGAASLRAPRTRTV